MKLYIGSKRYKPPGYLTVDIDPEMKPDIVADFTNMVAVGDCSVDEIVASHVLEHIDWPDSFKALSECARVLKPNGVLKVAVPDMALLLRMLLNGDSGFHVMALIYGVGGRESRFEQHRYGFLPGMLVDILELLGFADFDWWNSGLHDAADGWIPRYESEHTGMSLNMNAVKRREPAIDVTQLYKCLKERNMSDFLSVAGELGHTGIVDRNSEVPKLYQRIHFHLIEARGRIAHLEKELDGLKRQV